MHLTPHPSAAHAQHQDLSRAGSLGRPSITPLLSTLRSCSTGCPWSCLARRPLTCNTSAFIMNYHLINNLRAASATPYKGKQGRPSETSILLVLIAHCAITAPGLCGDLAPWGEMVKKGGKNQKKLKRGGGKLISVPWLLYYHEVPMAMLKANNHTCLWTQREQDPERQG